MITEIIAPTTNATQSVAYVVPEGAVAVLQLVGELGVDKAIDAQYNTSLGYKDLWQKNSQVRVTDTSNSIMIFGPITFRLDKDATSSNAGAQIEFTTGSGVGPA